MAESDIAKWYSGKHILITGSTGFMGKVMVEKLLRSCPEISTLYLLIRTRNGKDSTQRFEDFINSPVFEKLRDQPNASKIFEKIQCIHGDISLENLNLSNDDLKTIQDNVNVIFHMAANVRFDQQLKNALMMNTLGTKRVLDLARTFTKLNAFIHVSTTYCHCDLTELEEKTYPAPHDPRKILDISEWIEDPMLVLLTPHLIKNSPNTYAYTKCLSEQLVEEYSKDLPIAIARPSSVTAAWKEPIPGWVDNLNGPTGILVGAGKGVIRTMHCNADFGADIIPVDSTVNNIIVIGYHIGRLPKTDIQVFNVTCDKDKRLTWGEALEIGRKHMYQNPFSICLWYPGGSIKSSYFVHMLAAFFFHLIPAYLVDFLMVITRNKPFLVKIQKRIKKGLDVLQYYTTRPWNFHNEKMIALSNSLSKRDQEIFYTTEPYDPDVYLLNYILGARKYCLHEEPETIPNARKILKSSKAAQSNIAKWYSGKHILITGSTGFMGKVMVEKLLRSCPRISTLYLLIRTKNGIDPTQRMENVIASPVFDPLRNQPNACKLLAKLRCIHGDISQENLDLSNDDQRTLQDNVNVVFHMGANVRFDQSLKNALITNTLGTKNILELARTFSVLEAFVHVSTAYCQSDLTVLEEKTYPAPHDPRKLLEMVDWLDDSLLLLLTPHLLKSAPNTYSYTKCLTEHLVTEFSGSLPIAIARPGSVTASRKEPIPGWVDNLNGPTGILVGAGKGVIRTMHCNPEYEANIIPVDSTINSLIIVGYHLGSQPKTNLKVFNITSDKDNQITWGDALKLGKKHIRENPFSVCLWYPGGSIKSNYVVHAVAAFFFHLLPAYFVDFLLILVRRKPFLVKMQKRIKKGLNVLQYYTTKRWYFHNERMVSLVKSLNGKDQELFFTGGPKDYDKYILHYILGARKYCLNEDIDTIPRARKNLKRLYYLDLFKNFCFGYLVLSLFGEYIIRVPHEYQCFTQLLRKFNYA